ncbi:restriction endonuclease subunit S [Limnohabitans sp. Jir72]|uniref:restriction endonuclease subunit S n=1 Tax=Limnohabitans sp. Jir72 TaxID=1977909 RepID=UPI002101C7CA|nr:restriction endonuclease subunit S [Limnohabitans sp. Jir72]
MSRPLPKGWSWVPLGQYVENHDGRRVPISRSERESRQGAFPYYGASGVIDTIDGFTHEGEFVLIGEDGANLLTRSKPLAFLTRGKVWVNNHAHVLRCKPGFSNAYLAYYINSINLSAYVTGTAQPKLSQSMMNKIPIPVAPPEQQTEIVAEIEKQFSRLDEAVANLQRVKANLKRYKASVLKAAVEGRLVETKGEWRMSTLGDEGSIAGGLTKNQKRNDLPLKLPYLRVANVYANELRLDDIEYIGVAEKELEKLLVQKGDLLVVEGNGSPDQIGRVALWNDAIPNCVHQNHLIKIRFGDGVLSEWALVWMLSPVGRRAIEQVSVSTSGLHTLSVGKVSRLPIGVPSLEEQFRIVAEVDRQLSVLRGMVTAVDANLQRSKSLRQSILTNAFFSPSPIEGSTA